MTNSEILLLGIFFMQLIIWMYVRWIYLRLEYPKDRIYFKDDKNNDRAMRRINNHFD